MRKHLPTIYLVVFLVILLIPSLGMFVFGPSESENGEELVMPVLYTEEEGLNKYYLQELSDVFEQRFALRKHFVTAYSYICENLFGTSSQSGVIVGRDGWLFYNDTLADYQRTNILSTRQMHNAVRHLELINEYCSDNGIEFLFVIAPNKNTLYPEYMPYYLIQGEGQSNRQILDEILDETDINYIDFGNVAPFTNPNVMILYYHRDSHWNNLGACIASDRMLNALSTDHIFDANDSNGVTFNHIGDLEQMIYPVSIMGEGDSDYSIVTPDFTYVNEVESNFDFRIETTSDGSGTLLMYRDSFGSGILPYMAGSFARAFFSRSNACQINDFLSVTPDFLVIEKAERFISQLCTAPSRLPAPLRELPSDAVSVDISDLATAEAGEYVTITGTLPEGSYSDDSIILIVTGDYCFEAYPVSNLTTGAEGFQALLEKNAVSTDNIMVFIV